jgi:hypothetical protein
MRIRPVAIATCLTALTLAASPAAAQNGNGEVAVVFWKPSPDLVLQSGSITALGVPEVDFVSDFGIEDKWFTGFRASLGHNHKFNISYAPVKYQADTTITRTIVFNGRTFNIGAPASTDIKWDLWRFGYEWDFVSMEKGYVGVIADLKYNHVVASIDSPALTSSATTDQKAPVPTIGVAFRAYPVNAVALGAEFGGFKLSHGEDDAKFFDFDINGAVFFGPVGAQVGYRSVTVDYTIDDDAGDLKLQGPYISGILKF